MPYRYYSIHRPVGPGTFPKAELARNVENYDGKTLIMEIGREAYGHIDYDEALTDNEANSYELVRVPEQVKKNLCAHIPLDLHNKVREMQEASGKTLSEYMTWLIKEFYEKEGKADMEANGKRTVAFKVPEELFEQLKEYLKKHGITQNAFFVSCIQRAIEEDTK